LPRLSAKLKLDKDTTLPAHRMHRLFHRLVHGFSTGIPQFIDRLVSPSTHPNGAR
jgi:hypothetical protein